MRKIYVLFAICFLAIGSTYATTNHHNTDKPFVFIENNVEYAVFKNGDFDFNVITPRSSNVSVNTSCISFSFNTGHNYTPYIARNSFGEIIQINRTPIYYDYRGRVNQIGNVRVNYNSYGFVNSIGSLQIYYNNRGVYNRCNGYVNVRNRHYKPYCNTYIHPRAQRKIIRNRANYSSTTRYYNRKYSYTPRTNRPKYSSKRYDYRPRVQQKSKDRSRNKANTRQKQQVEQKRNLKKTNTSTRSNNRKNRDNYNTVTYTKRSNSNSYRR